MSAPLAVPARVLLDASGRPLSRPRPPEKMTAVKFIRKLAEEAGGINTPQGQAIHRLAMHFIRLQEELVRCAQLKDLSGDHTAGRIDAAAEGVYAVASERLERATQGQVVPDAWAVVCRDRPEEADSYRHMAIAALGGPVYPPVASDQDLGVE